MGDSRAAVSPAVPTSGVVPTAHRRLELAACSSHEKVTAHCSLRILLLALTPTPGHGAIGWTPLGAGGAPIHALAVDPTNPTTVYAGSWGDGVFVLWRFSGKRRGGRATVGAGAA